MKGSITIPCGFQFSLINKATGNRLYVPQAYRWHDWRVWPEQPPGIYYIPGDDKTVEWDCAFWDLPQEEVAGWALAGWSPQFVS